MCRGGGLAELELHGRLATRRSADLWQHLCRAWAEGQRDRGEDRVTEEKTEIKKRGQRHRGEDKDREEKTETQKRGHYCEY